MLLSQIVNLKGASLPLVIALCGAGGKTSALFDLAADFKRFCPDRPVVVLTTTRMMAARKPSIDYFISVEALSEIKALSPGITMIARGMDDQGKIYGFEPEDVDRWIEAAPGELGVALIEADGANKKPLKAPREGEPRFPGKTQIALGVLGAEMFDMPAVDSGIHRLPLFLELTGLMAGETVSSEAVIALICSENGLFRTCPSNAHKIVLINKVEGHHSAFIERVKAGTGLQVITVERGLWT